MPVSVVDGFVVIDRLLVVVFSLPVLTSQILPFYFDQIMKQLCSLPRRRRTDLVHQMPDGIEPKIQGVDEMIHTSEACAVQIYGINLEVDITRASCRIERKDPYTCLLSGACRG